MLMRLILERVVLCSGLFNAPERCRKYPFGGRKCFSTCATPSGNQGKNETFGCGSMSCSPSVR